MNFSIVKFIDNLEDYSVPHYGVLDKDGFITCWCCGGLIEPESYTILEIYNPQQIDNFLLDNLVEEE